MICEPLSADGAVDVKRCPMCSEIKLKTEFHRRPGRSGGVRSKCKNCERQIGSERKNKKKIFVQSKSCSKCLKNLDAGRFCVNSRSPDGLNAHCKSCQRDYANTLKNKEKIIVFNKKCTTCLETKHSSCFHQNLNSRDGLSAKCKSCVSGYDARRLAMMPEVYIEKAAKRRARSLDATPKWLGQEDHDTIRTLYKSCKEITNNTGIKHEVDHIHPLHGENFSGLHVPWNLRITTSRNNRQKSNLPPKEEYDLFFHCDWQSLVDFYGDLDQSR